MRNDIIGVNCSGRESKDTINNSLKVPFDEAGVDFIFDKEVM
jgi:hypothetical protein